MIYLDNAATTRMSENVIRRMHETMQEDYGNPSSIYEYGIVSKGKVEKARSIIASTLQVKPDEIYFTSGGTEANNWAIMGTALSKKDKGHHIITSRVEHKSVLKTCQFLGKMGYEISYIDVDAAGIIDISQLEQAIRSDTILISIMCVNNEVGSIMPLKKIGELAASRDILFHTDAVQAYGHIPVDCRGWNIDMLSVSAHKFHGPKGVGFLYIKNGTNIYPLINGGNQERGMRSGTENVAGIVGMAEAAREMSDGMDEELRKSGELKQLLYRELSTRVEGVHAHTNYKEGAPGILSVVVDGVEAVCLVDSLGQKGVCVSAGSACNSKELQTSHVLMAMGVDEADARSTIRWSLSKYNNREEILKAAEIFEETVNHLREIYCQ